MIRQLGLLHHDCTCFSLIVKHAGWEVQLAHFLGLCQSAGGHRLVGRPGKYLGVAEIHLCFENL